MNEWTLIIAGIGLYWALVVAARSAGWLPDYVGTMGPVLTIHTKRGKQLLDRIAGPKRFWRAWGNLGLGVASVVMVGVFVQLLVSAVSIIRNPPAPSPITQPKNVLVIPGVNDFLPLSVAPEIVFGLLVGMVVHEGGHGVLSRVADIEVSSMGVVLLAIIPIGAFVEPDEDAQRAAPRGARARMFAAGVTNNFVVTGLVFLLLFGPVVGAIGVASGALVAGSYAGSPADQAGFGQGDRIVAIEGTKVASNADLDDVLRATESRTVTVTLGDGSTIDIERSLFVTAVAQDSPFAAFSVNTTITHVNGTEVHTSGELEGILENASVVTFRAASGETATGRVGALVTVVPNGPMAESGFDVGSTLIVTRFAGHSVWSGADLGRAIDATPAGTTVSVVGYQNGTRVSHDVTLGTEDDGSAFLGVIVAQGVSGLAITDFGVQTFPAERYLALLGGDPSGSFYLGLLFGGNTGVIGDFVRGVIVTLFLPFIGTIDPTLPLNFPGFVDWNQSFYVVESSSPLAFLGGGVFLLANLLFWTGWINLNLGFFNCIPAFPLDGGHLLRMAAESVTSRLPISDRRAATRAVTTSVGLLMLASLVLMVFGPQLLN